MNRLIIDTNVPLKAANMHPEDEIDRECSQACMAFIKAIMESDDVLVLDSGGEILKEYNKKINTDKEDTVATQFLIWVLRNQMTNKVIRQEILKNANGDYIDFPNSLALKKFDRSDRKFVALAKAHPSHPDIYNGSDTDWWIFREELKKEGVNVVFLSVEYMKSRCKRKNNH